MKNDDRQRLRSVPGLMGAITNTVRTPTAKAVWGTNMRNSSLKENRYFKGNRKTATLKEIMQQQFKEHTMK